MNPEDAFNPEDPLPDLIAAIDQAIASAPLVARTAQAFFTAFVGAGFAEKHAIYLTAVQLHSTPGSPPA